MNGMFMGGNGTPIPPFSEPRFLWAVTHLLRYAGEFQCASK